MKPYEFLAKLRNVTRDCHSDMVCDVFALVMEYTGCEREKAQETREKNAERQRQYRKLRMQCHSDSNSDTPVTELNGAVVLLSNLSSSQEPLKENSQKEKKEVVARGSRIPEEFQPSEESLSWAVDLGIDHLAAQLIIDEFRDFWSAVPGAKGRKLDWDKTWKNRVREVVSRRKANGQEHGASNNGRTFRPGERFLTSSGKFF